jgi:hypothetical protein
MSIAVNPYTAFVGWPVVVEKFSAGKAKKARYARECPSSSSSLSRCPDCFAGGCPDVATIESYGQVTVAWRSAMVTVPPQPAP